MTIDIPQQIWNEFKATNKHYNKRQYEILQPGWTDLLYEQLWATLKIPCPFSFTNAKVNKHVGSNLLSIKGTCNECGNKINILANENGTGGLRCSVSTQNTKDIIHNKKRQLKGETRRRIAKELTEKGI